MIGRRCTHSNVFSRPVLIARNLLSSQVSYRDSTRKCIYLSQVTYCGGYSGVEPPLSIPNREVKRTSADGTAPPGGRVGRCRFSECPTDDVSRAFFVRGCAPHGKALIRGLRPLRPLAPLKSLSDFAVAKSRDRVGRLMPTSLCSTCYVSGVDTPAGACSLPTSARTQF